MNHPNQLIPEIVNRLIQQFQPESIFLFGSHAWGNPDSNSDLDLLVIVPQSDVSPTKRASIAYRCLRDIPYPLDILVRTPKEIDRFAQVPSSLEHQILSQGKRLYG
ncbi:nucleotidyltransferase domain-containing protein [Methylomagnum sp.]